MFREAFERECRVCHGSGYKFSGNATTIPCRACGGTGLSSEAQELEKEYEDVFTCKHCGAAKTHFRLRGYVCTNCERRR